MITYLDLYWEDYLANLDISANQLEYLLNSIGIHQCILSSSEIEPKQENINIYFKSNNKDYISFRLKVNTFYILKDYYRYFFVEFPTLEKMNNLINKYKKLKAFV